MPRRAHPVPVSSRYIRPHQNTPVHRRAIGEGQPLTTIFLFLLLLLGAALGSRAGLLARAAPDALGVSSGSQVRHSAVRDNVRAAIIAERQGTKKTGWQGFGDVAPDGHVAFAVLLVGGALLPFWDEVIRPTSVSQQYLARAPPILV